MHTLFIARERAGEIPPEFDIYGWLVGSWNLDVAQYAGADLRGQGLHGEVHCGWVLEGRALADVWIMPRTEERTAALDRTNNLYGLTLRVWDPALEAWRISWVNPVSGRRDEQIGRRVGQEIVQVGTCANGTVTRWRFTAITSASFRWLGEVLNLDGCSWRRESEFLAHRRQVKP